MGWRHVIFTGTSPPGGPWSIAIIVSVCPLSYLISHVKTSRNWPLLGLPRTKMQYVLYFRFVNDVKFSHKGAYMVYGKAYGRGNGGMSVSGRQLICGWWNWRQRRESEAGAFVRPYHLPKWTVKCLTCLTLTFTYTIGVLNKRRLTETCFPVLHHNVNNNGCMPIKWEENFVQKTHVSFLTVSTILERLQASTINMVD